MEKRGVSPMVSTVVLIMIVVVLAIIVLLWYQGFRGEQILKFSDGVEKPIEKLCSDVGIRSFVNEDSEPKSFGFHNIGNVPIYSINLKITKNDGTSIVEKLGSSQGGKVDTGLSTTFKDIEYLSDWNEAKIIPVILGKTKSGVIRQFTCPEDLGVII